MKFSKFISTSLKLKTKLVESIDDGKINQIEKSFEKLNNHILSNFIKFDDFFENSKIMNKYDYTSQFLFNPPKKNFLPNQCKNCGSSDFVDDKYNYFCSNCGLSKKKFIDIQREKTSDGIKNIKKIEGSDGISQTCRYNKMNTFSDHIDKIQGVSRIKLPLRYSKILFPNYIQKMNFNVKDISEDEIIKMLKYFNIYRKYSNFIPNIYYILTGEPYINISPHKRKQMEDMYRKILKINSQHFNLEKVPPYKFTIRKILEYLDIDVDFQKLDQIKGLDKEWTMNRRWLEIMEYYSNEI